ncbi:MAG: 4Fe-4S binding protein [Chloroflexi bacterium]|nr:4Fe-4S binding protein [Chloroflexota bacterium]
MSKTKIIRVVTVALVILVIVSGGVGKLNYGGICSLGTWDILITCPLGFLERSLAARELLPQWPSAVLILFSVLLLGRVFCAWVCPSVLLRRVFGNKGELTKQNTKVKESIWASYSPYAVLGGVLIASFIFRFPVFCFFCPIGLFFGAFYAVMRLFSLDSPSLELVLFPTMLGLELWVLKSWCRSICPLGALLSIVGNLNPFFMPEVKKNKCLTAKGINCQACKRVCPEGIDLGNLDTGLSPNSCTKCLECSVRCPAKAIKFPLWS